MRHTTMSTCLLVGRLLCMGQLVQSMAFTPVLPCRLPIHINALRRIPCPQNKLSIRLPRKKMQMARSGGDPEPPPPFDFSASKAFSQDFVPSDFLKLHEMIVGATSAKGSDVINVGAAIADEVQRSYMLSVCAFEGTAEYARKMSILDESDALKFVRSETVKLPREEASMQIYPEQGKWMAQLLLSMGAKKVLEIGTFTGYSSTSMASVLPQGGRLVCCDINEDYIATAKEAWRRGGVTDKIDLRIGHASDTIRDLMQNGEQGTFDAVFIDADKENSDEYYEAALELLRDGGVVLIDDSLWSGRVVNDREHTDAETCALRDLNSKVCKDARVMASVLPIADGVTMAVKLPRWAVDSCVTWGSAGQQRIGNVSPLDGIGGKVVAVEGNIAAGKTTLIKGLARVCSGERQLRVFEERPDERMLASYYKNPKVMGFPFQVYMLDRCISALRTAIQMATEGHVCVLDRSVWGNGAFATANVRTGNISPEQFKAYKGLVGDDASADLLLYLDVPAHTCAHRCASRGRDSEGGIDVGYLEQLDIAHFELVRDAAARATPPVLVLDWREYGREEDASALIAACLRGTVRLPTLTYASKVPNHASSSSLFISVQTLREMRDKETRGEEYLISDPRASPRTFLQVLAPMLTGGSALGLTSGTATPDVGGVTYIQVPPKGTTDPELGHVYRRAVLHALSKLVDVVLVPPQVS